MTENTINADVTMADPSRSGGVGRQRPRALSGNTINADVTMVDSAPSAGTSRRFRVGDQILGRYIVESELGQGGMGIVYLCLDKTGRVKMAVKGLPPEVSHNSDEMEAVRENYQLVSALQHPNIASVRHLEMDPATGDYFLVMTYAQGVSLKRWLREYGGREHRAAQLKVLRQIASALDYAHNAKPKNIIHRDIKPDNVMVDEIGNVMVLDFGLAAQVRSSLSRVSQVVTSRSGTPAYKSPEQWLAQAQHAPSDQYSLGVIAYQMFAGELPFDSDDIEILKHAVSFDRVPKIRGERKRINAVFAKVLAKKPHDRFASCTAFVDALEGKESDSGSSSTAMMVIAVGVLLAFVGLCGWWMWKSEKDIETTKQEAVARRLEKERRVAEEERQAEEAKRKEEARIAAEQAEAKRIAEEKRLVDEKRKAEEAKKIAAERAEVERKAKAEAKRIADEKAAADAERKRQQDEIARQGDQKRSLNSETQKAIALFKKGDWQTGLAQAEKADQGDAELLFWLGTCYDIGLGAKCDSQKAVAYFQRAAEKGQIDAQCELGRRYETGRGVNKDLAQAKKWYQAAASQGSKNAEKDLRRLYAQESSVSSGTSLAQRRKEREEAARIARESEQLRKLREEVATLRNVSKNMREEVSSRPVVQQPATRTVSLSGRSSVRFTSEDAQTLSLLKFSNASARSHYQKACEHARQGAHNKAKVRSEYDLGRACGGPEWPELEAWLDWWK